MPGQAFDIARQILAELRAIRALLSAQASNPTPPTAEAPHAPAPEALAPVPPLPRDAYNWDGVSWGPGGALFAGDPPTPDV